MTDLKCQLRIAQNHHQGLQSQCHCPILQYNLKDTTTGTSGNIGGGNDRTKLLST
jgi:hypothetical protein